MASPLLAEGSRDPNNARGVDAGKLYSFSDVDSVNTFNGNLMIRLPIGQVYPVSSSLTYGLRLTYNSKIWDYEYIPYDDGDGTGEHQRLAIPERDSNAGLGWSLSLGRLIPAREGTVTTDPIPWTYLAPDGARHELGVRHDDALPRIGVTNDGSYIRATLTSTGHTLEFPNGHIHHFKPNGDLERIEDRFGNWISVTYGVMPDGAPLWTIRDSTAVRVHTVAFERVSVEYEHNPNFKDRVKRVELASFDGGQAVYTFDYRDTVIQKGHCGSWLEGLPTTSDVALLSGITLPDGTTFVPSYNTADVNAVCESGTIRQLVLPTLGTIEWKHGSYELSATDCSPPQPDAARGLWSYATIGVKERTFNPRDGGLPMTWKYDPQLLPTEPLEGAHRCGDRLYDGVNSILPAPPQVFTNTVTEPSGRQTKYYFSALNASARVGTFEGPNLLDDYGLPFTRSKPSGVFFLSAEIRDGAGTVLQRKYMRYQNDRGSMWVNRPIGERTEYAGDFGCGTSGTALCYTESIKSDFDGYGHFRKIVESSNFGPVRTTSTDYNGTAAAPRAIAFDTPWILDVYTKTTVTEAGPADVAPSVLETRVCIDPANGALLGRRTLKEREPGNADVVVRYQYRNGNVATEDWYGGDRTALRSDDLCSVGDAGTSEYQIERTYSAGVLQTEKYRGATYFTVDQEIDPNTGLVQRSRDSAGVATAFNYDDMGRLVSVLPDGGVETVYDYRPASRSADGVLRPAILFSRHGGQQGTGRATKVAFDGLGRVRAEGELMPARDGQPEQWSYSYKSYDGAGRIVRQTVPGTAPEPALPTTQFKYDTLDRPVEIVAPDLARTYTKYIGEGVRAKKRTAFVRLPQGDSPIDVTEVHDGLGRLVEVLENSGPTTAAAPTGALTRTRYSYDAAGNLRLVTMAGKETVQTRVFDYDGRGFLRWEMHPESGMKSYTYDSRGKMLSRRVSEAASHYDLELRYDSAERLVEVAGRNPAPAPQHPLEILRNDFRPLKTFEYADTNATDLPAKTGFGQGRLYRASRYNYPPTAPTALQFGGIVKVVERYYYLFEDGLPTDRITEVWSYLGGTSFTRHSSIDVVQSHDEYGQLQRVSYPRVEGSALPGSRAVEYQYQRGRLTSVSDAVSHASYGTITYHGNGMRDTIVHSNGMTDVQELDVSGLPRPRRLVSSPSTTSCTAPVIVEQPIGAQIDPDVGTRLTVLATGTAPLSYQWWDATGATAQAISGETESGYLAKPTTTRNYYVTVSNACKTVTSFTVVVTPDACPAVRVTAERAINKDGSVTLSARPVGAGTIGCNWYLVANGSAVGSGTTITVPSGVGLQAVEVVAASDCGASGKARLGDMTPARVVTSLAATLAPDRKKIVVTWPAIAGMSSYTLVRRSAAGEDLFEVAGTAFEDTALNAGATYAYLLTGGKVDGSFRPVVSNVDLATTLMFSSVAPGLPVELRYFNEILAAVNATRAIAGWPKLTWQSVMPSSVPLPAQGGGIYSFYLTALRPRMDEALQALGAPVAPYSDPDPKLVAIRAVHVVELQGRTQ